MSEAYWLGSFHQEWEIPSDVDSRQLSAGRLELITNLSAKFGLQPSRLNRLDWLTGRMSGLYQRAALCDDAPKSPLSFLWPSLPLFGHSLLQNACASLTQDETTLSALVEEKQICVEGALLGSPAAVGRFNLAPQACFRAHVSAAWNKQPLIDTQAAVGAALKKLEFEPETLACLALSGPFLPEEVEKPEMWQGAAWFIAPPERGILEALNWLIGQLPASSPAIGLLASFSADRRSMITLVERI